MSRILVADDCPDQLQVQKMVLEAGGHEVAVATCPSDAASSVERGEADLLIMDLKFPNAQGHQDAGEGLALIRRIRQSGCRTPVIVLSGWPDEIYGQPEEKMVSQVLVKPVGMAALLAIIAQLVEGG